MPRFRLTHTTRKFYVHGFTHHIWVAQQWDATTEKWEDRTNEYPTAEEAELALLRDLVGQEFEPTFEH